jgi:hypothetical protein
MFITIRLHALHLSERSSISFALLCAWDGTTTTAIARHTTHTNTRCDMNVTRLDKKALVEDSFEEFFSVTLVVLWIFDGSSAPLWDI